MRNILPEAKNDALRMVSRELSLSEITNSHTKRLVADMKALLSKEKYGVALAAVQVGEPVRLFIVSGRALAKDGARNSPSTVQTKRNISPQIPEDQVYINPTLLKLSRGRKLMHEGCLSIRGFWGEVPRAEKATIHAYDAEGHEFTRGASGFLAHIFQHEMDHLEGILYTDKAKQLYEEKVERAGTAKAK